MTEKEIKKPEVRHTWHPELLQWSYMVGDERVYEHLGISKPKHVKLERIALITEYNAIHKQDRTKTTFDQRKYSKDELVKRLPWLWTESTEKTKASVNGKLRSIRNRLKKLNEKKPGTVVIPEKLSWLPPQATDKKTETNEVDALLKDLFKAK